MRAIFKYEVNSDEIGRGAFFWSLPNETIKSLSSESSESMPVNSFEKRRYG